MIEQLREKRRQGLSFRKLGKMFGVSHETARKIAGDIKTERMEAKNELRTCKICGAEFWAYDKTKQSLCSGKCSGISRGCPVAVLNSDGRVMRAFNSVAEASREMGLNRDVIGFASNEEDKRHKTAGGYKWIRL